MGRRKQYTLPAEWADYGASWGADGMLYLGEWRRGFTVHDLRAMFWDCQQVRGLRSDLARARRDLAAAQATIDELKGKAAWYRRQCVLQAQLGLSLSRIDSHTR